MEIVGPLLIGRQVEMHDPALRQVVMDDGDRQPAPAQAAADELVLRRHVAHPPGLEGQDIEVPPLGQIRGITDDDLRFLPHVPQRQLDLAGRQRVVGRGGRQEKTVADAVGDQRIVLTKRLATDADCCPTTQDQFHKPTEFPHFEPEGDGRKLGLEPPQNRKYSRRRHKHADRDRQFGLQALTHAASLGTHHLQVANDSARVRQHGPALFGQPWLARSAPFKERHTKLALQVADRVAHHGLRPVEKAGGGRKAAGIGHSEKDLKLVEGGVGIHGARASIQLFDKIDLHYHSFVDGCAGIYAWQACSQGLPNIRGTAHVVHPSRHFQPTRL